MRERESERESKRARERERERGRASEREGERERERESINTKHFKKIRGWEGVLFFFSILVGHFKIYMTSVLYVFLD